MAVTINGTTGILAPDIGIDGTTLTVDAVNDRVGIGTTTPFGKLQVRSGTNANFSFSTGSGESSLEILNDAGSANVPLNVRASEYKIKIQGTEKLHITGDGKIGIGGLTDPGALLSIPAGESNTPRFAIESAVDDNDFTITQYEDGNGTYTMLGQNVKLNSSGNNTILDSGHKTAGILLDARNHGSITFLTGGTNAVSEPVKITSDGHVNIGGASPSSTALTVKMATNKHIGFSPSQSEVGNVPALVAFQDSGSLTDIGFRGTTFRVATGSAERLRIDSNGRILVGPGAIATPKCGYAGIDVPNYDYAIVMGGSDGNGNRANNAIKDGRFCGAHYNNAEEPVGIIRYSIGSTASELHMGGGSSLINAATRLSFYTAANTTTTGGSERLRINSDGKIEIHSNGSYGNSPKALNIGSRTSASYQGSLALARGEALGGGTGPYMELIHGPDGGTQRTHQIYSYVGDFRIYADAAENLEISGVETKIKDSSRSDVAIFNSNGLEMEKNTARLFGRYVGKTNTASNYELTHWTAGSFRILEVFGFINPNAAGSGVYYDPAHFYVYNATGWNGSAVSYYLGIKHVAPGARTYASSGTSSDPTQNIVAKWGNTNSTGTTNGGHYLKFEWSGANTSNNYQSYFRVIRRM